MEKELENQNEREIRADKLFICIYDENKIGLFKSKPYTSYEWNPYTRETRNSYSYIIYDGIDSNHTGIFFNGCSCKSGYSLALNVDNAYSATCQINEVMSYNDVRFQMYANFNDYKDIDFKYTDSIEIAKVLMFAHKLLDKENIKQNKKTKK